MYSILLQKAPVLCIQQLLCDVRMNNRLRPLMQYRFFARLRTREWSAGCECVGPLLSTAGSLPSRGDSARGGVGGDCLPGGYTCGVTVHCDRLSVFFCSNSEI